MRNYIILNGKNSNEINGLLISELAPISKPLIRTNKEEIDGRSGDIITKLGYSAYDKEIEIGLYGNYNIDEIISYFNSEGLVTFSNEPEKFYKYTILDQIDFEKLIRFKTAKVKFHVQPFKFSLLDGTRTFNFTIQKSEENLLITGDAKGGYGLTVTKNSDTSFIVNGTSTQNWSDVTTQKDVSYSAGTYVFSTDKVFQDDNGTQGVINLRLFFSDTEYTDYSIEKGKLSVEFTITKPAIANFIHINYFGKGAVFTNVPLNLSLKKAPAITEFIIRNNGNIYSRPILTIYGTGTINLSLNDIQLFVIELGDEETQITIDTDKMEAYNNESKELKNRLVTGNYENFKLNVGKNKISWTGAITKVEISNYTRFL